MTLSSSDAVRLDQMRRAAKTLRKTFDMGQEAAVQQVKAVLGKEPEGHADFLHVVARQNGFLSWPKLKHAAESIGLDRATQQDKLKMALFHGRAGDVETLLAETPDLPLGNFGLLCALYRLDLIEAALVADPSLATEAVGPRRPILHVAFSHYHRIGGDTDASIRTAELLVAHGANVNDAFVYDLSGEDSLSALYGALGHARNLGLARWLLEQGANPNDGESLYHATELGHSDGVKLLLQQGADPSGTNALLRAMDFNNVEMVRLLIQAGADPEESRTDGYGALHHAATRDVSGDVVQVLMEAGGSVSRTFAGFSPLAWAKLVGALDVATKLKQAGAPIIVSPDLEPLLGQTGKMHVDPAKIPHELDNLLQDLMDRDGTFERIQDLVAAGFPWDKPGGMGVTPVQKAGWCGLPDVLAFFLKQRPDLSHVSDYGGTLFSSILHGAENAPQGAGRDHLACMEMVLTHGVAIPKKALSANLRPDLLGFLQDWARAHPGAVVEWGIY